MDPEPYVVVCFGILSYKVLGEFADEASAESDLRWWQEQAREPGGVEVLPLSRHCTPDDFQVRQQSDLDALTHAIVSSYPPYKREL